MRPLYWTRIVTQPTVVQPVFVPVAVPPPPPPQKDIPEDDTVDGQKRIDSEGSQCETETKSNTPTTTIEKEEPKIGKQKPVEEEILWLKIQETELENLDEFGDLFSRQTIKKRDKKESTAPKLKMVAKAKVLDSKRSQNIGIIVKSMHVDFSEVENAIYNCDTSVVSLEVLQQILEIRASPEELKMIEELSAQEGVVMDEPETFLLKLSRVSYFVQRISCLVFQAEFDEAANGIQRKLDVLAEVCNFLVANENIRVLFSIILTFGNYMNGGNRQRGQADGFGLDILPKLKDVKSNDTKVTLLHYIVHTYVKHCRQAGTALLDLEYPLPSKYDIEKCNNIDFDDLLAQLKSLRDRLASSETRIEEMKEEGEEDVEEGEKNNNSAAVAAGRTFKLKMQSFAQEADNQLSKLHRELDECKVLFQRTIQFYKFHTRNNEKVERPGQFFDLWTQFTVDVEDIWKRHLNELKLEL